ncbi:hypothetical protein H0R92_08210 [Treponema sp. OMZ 840]|uniref:hypothetical protein n=1 Tax=Treponema sp. OMZ 840 TaxID=244313 RepID=UPI003D89E57C
MKKFIGLVCIFTVCTVFFTGCMSFLFDEAQDTSASQAETDIKQEKEDSSEKFLRLLADDYQRFTKEKETKTIEESIEITFQPQSITSIKEITTEKLTEPGKPYYFKVKALYKGYDAEAKRAIVRDLNRKQSSISDTAFKASFGVDTDSYPLALASDEVSDLPPEANAAATFYLVAVFDDNSREIASLIMFVRDIEKSVFNPAHFILTSGMRYITAEDAHVPTGADAMAAYLFGGSTGNAPNDIFDPTEYPLTDLMDARAAMNKKDFSNQRTFPTVRVKYVSEVLFLGQSNTAITLSTTDNILTEKMSFTGRASSLKKGEKVRVYYTIAKDPLEEWEIQAIERL